MTQLPTTPARSKSKRPAATSPLDAGHPEIEIISESSKKKAKKAAPSASDSARQHAVSFAEGIVRAPSSSSLRLDFGTISSDEDLPAAIADGPASKQPSAQKRSRKPSAKAVYMSSPSQASGRKGVRGEQVALPAVKIKSEPGTEVIALDSPFQVEANGYGPTKRNRLAAGPIEVSDEEEEAAGTSDCRADGRVYNTKPSCVPPSDVPVVLHGEVNESDSGEDIEAQIAALMKMKALMKEKKENKGRSAGSVQRLESSAISPAHRVGGLDLVQAIDACQDDPYVVSSDPSKGKLGVRSSVTSPSPSRVRKAEVPESVHDDTSHDASDAKDPEAHLPTLPICELKPIARDPAPASGVFLRLDLVRDHLDDADFRLIEAADEFVSFGPFANHSRADPASFAVDAGHRLCYGNPRRNAVGIMLGSVATCNLVNPHNYSANIEGGYIVRKITITPTEMTYRRFAGFLGAKFRWAALKAPVDGGNEVTFSTRKKGAGGGPVGSPIRVKNPKFYGPSAHAAGSKDPATWYASPFPPFLDFDSEVPIYDARNSDFTFDKAGFDYLKNLPQYRVKGVRHPVDLPADSLVAVAYTSNIYGVPRSSFSAASGDLEAASETSSSDVCPILSLNVQLVVLLGSLFD